MVFNKVLNACSWKVSIFIQLILEHFWTNLIKKIIQIKLGALFISLFMGGVDYGFALDFSKKLQW